MPIVWERNESRKKREIVMADIPMRLIPNSSGKGEAIIIAPKTGRVQEKYRVWRIFLK